MAYLISEMGAELLQDVQRFCDMEIKEQCKSWDREGFCPEELYRKIGELGYQTLTVPESYGGLGISRTDAAAILERIAMADAGIAVTLAGNNLALAAVLLGGNEEQKQEICDMVLGGSLGAFCMTENNAGSDAASMETVAEKQKDGTYIIHGRKLFITNGSLASWYCVAAKLKEGDEEKGITLFLLPEDTPGLSHGVKEDKMGLRTSDTCEVVLENCLVPEDSLLGEEGGGMKILLGALTEGRAWMACVATGVAQRALDESVTYGKKRIQFGRPIVENQGLQFRIAEMEMKTEAARQLTAYALALLDQGEDAAAQCSMAKCVAAETAVYVTGCAMEIFGGYGYSREYPVEKLLRDARVFLTIEGTTEMQKTLIARRKIRG